MKNCTEGEGSLISALKKKWL